VNGRRAVFISPITPALTGNGLAMRMGQFLQALSRIAAVDVIIVPVAGDPLATDPLPVGAGIRVHRIDIAGRTDAHFSLLSRLADYGARLEAFRTYGKPSLSRGLSPPVSAEIARLIDTIRPDIVHIGRSYLLPLVERLSEGLAMTLDLDEDDRVSYATQARLARRYGQADHADWLEQEGLACDALIARFARRFRCAYVANPSDRRRLAGRHPELVCAVAENSVVIPGAAAKRDDGETLLFVGTLSYAPNEEGLVWLSREVLPRLRVPYRLVVAGAGASAALTCLARRPRVHFLGQAPDLARLYRRATLALAPLRAGGGTRIKLIEAAAHGIASVSTPFAAAGIDWGAEAGGWRAASPADYAQACRSGLKDAGERAFRAAAGFEWVKRHCSRDRLVARLAQSLEAHADRGSGAGAHEGTT
jgi:polysaccharide biosynthesis protein PslH